MSQGAQDIKRTGEASQWLADLRDSPDDETLNRWLRWCEQDPRNARAYQRMQQLWRQMDQIHSPLKDIDVFVPARKMPFVYKHRYMALAAALLAAVGIGWLMFSTSTPQAVAVPAAENRTTRLPDGSTLNLGAKTTIAVNFSEQKRVLQLSPGQAYFEVEPDIKRPFIVRAGGLQVTAIGTAFDVKHEPARIVVTVREGLVEVAPLLGEGGANSRSSAEKWRVAAGHQFVYSSSDAATTLASVDTSAVLAWREGRLEYVRAPLASVIADINRYAQHPVGFTDPADPKLAPLTFTGTVFTDSIDGWLTALPAALPLRVVRTESGDVRIASQ